jgi:hypothetical protein
MKLVLNVARSGRSVPAGEDDRHGHPVVVTPAG